MKINKMSIYFIVAALLLQIVSFFYFLSTERKRTMSLKCISSFTRNITGTTSYFYSGESILILDRDGVGRLIINGRTEGTSQKNFHYAYLFDYYITDEGVLKSKLRSISTGIRNQISKEVFKKNFIELDFNLKGGLRIYKFSNVYVLSTPGFIVSICAPI